MRATLSGSSHRVIIAAKRGAVRHKTNRWTIGGLRLLQHPWKACGRRAERGPFPSLLNHEYQGAFVRGLGGVRSLLDRWRHSVPNRKHNCLVLIVDVLSRQIASRHLMIIYDHTHGFSTISCYKLILAWRRQGGLLTINGLSLYVYCICIGDCRRYKWWSWRRAKDNVPCATVKSPHGNTRWSATAVVVGHIVCAVLESRTASTATSCTTCVAASPSLGCVPHAQHRLPPQLR